MKSLDFVPRAMGSRYRGLIGFGFFYLNWLYCYCLGKGHRESRGQEGEPLRKLVHYHRVHEAGPDMEMLARKLSVIILLDAPY